MQKHLEEEVSKTAAVVVERQSNLAKIDAQIANARLRIEKSEADRKALAPRAAMLDAQAVAALAKARAEHTTAQVDLYDLAHALEDCQQRLIEAEREAKAARQALAKFETDILKRQRVNLAGQLDQAIAAFAGLYRQYEKLGRAIVDMPDSIPQNMHGMMATSHEAVLGDRRVRAAVPKFLEQALQSVAHDEQKKENLATSESRFWNLSPEQPEKAKAA